MGASGWHYFTPYQPNVNTALQSLRERVFKDRSCTEAPDASDAISKYLATLPKDNREHYALMRRAALAAQKLPEMLKNRRITEDPSEFEDFMLVTSVIIKGDSITEADMKRVEDYFARFDVRLGEKAASPSLQAETIEQLLEQAAENGTHSILDIQRISDTVDYGAAAPMPEQMRQQIYGTTTPTRADIETHHYEATEDIERWQAYYVVVYKNGQPNELYFEGVSGD